MGVAPSTLLPPIRLQQFPLPDPLAPADQRTAFLMFSKGYKVNEPELGEFITQCFGNCFESLNMQETPGGEQPLFAQIVFYSPEIIDAALNGRIKAKFTVNGKHVYVRKFVW